MTTEGSKDNLYFIFCTPLRKILILPKELLPGRDPEREARRGSSTVA